MGRFDSTAEFYRYREPYSSQFFERVAGQLGLTKSTRMLDVACGPGNLAIGFAPFVGSCIAVDVEPAMLRVARAAAVEADACIDFVQVAIQDLQVSDKSIDFVTIGRALHWLPREPTIAVLDRIIAADGRLAICNAAPTTAPVNQWAEKFRDLRRKWSEDHDESRYRPDLAAWFASSKFQLEGEIAVNERFSITIEQLIQRGLSFSVTSPEVLGDRRPAFESELRDAVEPYAVDGVLEEEIVATATILAAVAS